MTVDCTFTCSEYQGCTTLCVRLFCGVCESVKLDNKMTRSRHSCHHSKQEYEHSETTRPVIKTIESVAQRFLSTISDIHSVGNYAQWVSVSVITVRRLIRKDTVLDVRINSPAFNTSTNRTSGAIETIYVLSPPSLDDSFGGNVSNPFIITKTIHQPGVSCWLQYLTD